MMRQPWTVMVVFAIVCRLASNADKAIVLVVPHAAAVNEDNSGHVKSQCVHVSHHGCQRSCIGGCC